MALTVNGKRTGRAAATERRELMEQVEDDYWARVKRVKQAKTDFTEALKKLAAVDPNWEAWYDDDANIPPLIHWSNREQMDEIIRRIEARVSEITSQQCACYEVAGDNSNCPVHAAIVAQTETVG